MASRNSEKSMFYNLRLCDMCTDTVGVNIKEKGKLDHSHKPEGKYSCRDTNPACITGL